MGTPVWPTGLLVPGPASPSSVSRPLPFPELVQTLPLMHGELWPSPSQAPCGLLMGCEMRDFRRHSSVRVQWGSGGMLMLFSVLKPVCLSVCLPRCSFWINFLLKVARRIPSKGSSPSSQVSPSGPWRVWWGDGVGGCVTGRSSTLKPGRS